jgi:hypothetical protein
MLGQVEATPLEDHSLEVILDFTHSTYVPLFSILLVIPLGFLYLPELVQGLKPTTV